MFKALYVNPYTRKNSEERCDQLIETLANYCDLSSCKPKTKGTWGKGKGKKGKGKGKSNSWQGKGNAA